jgi:peptidoglycan hydrolase-like protein with peptidoglycan-binding domain
MGKFPTSLLVIVFELYLANSIFADEEVRKVQEALRKRHLFFGDTSGASSPVLTSAIVRYQQTKGFAPTGVINFETSNSLGISRPMPEITKMPFVLQGGGEMRDANGQQLPGAVIPRRWSLDEHPIQFDHAPTDQQIALALATSNNDLGRRVNSPFKQKSSMRPHRIRARKETNPMLLAYHTVDHAMKFLLGATDSKKKRAATRRL